MLGRVGLALLVLAIFSGCLECPSCEQGIKTFFCPEDNCSEVIVSEFDLAQESIDVAVYSFTSDKLANALARASARGVRVRLVCDYSQSRSQYSLFSAVQEIGISACAKKSSGLMHNKFAVIDGKKVIAGSFNYTSAADTKNDEFFLVIESKKTAKEFTLEFQELLNQC